MKKIICLLMVVALVLSSFVGCETNTDYNSSTYDPLTFSMPTISIPSFSFDDVSIPSLPPASSKEEERKSITVYVSRTGKIHRNPRCSGMKYYTEMDYYEALDEGYERCKNCY